MTIKDEVKNKAGDFTTDYEETTTEKTVYGKPIKKNPVSLERVEKLEGCLRDKDKRISKLEIVINKTKTAIASTGFIVSIIFVVTGHFFFSRDFPCYFDVYLKMFGVGCIVFLVSIFVSVMIAVISNIGCKDENKNPLIDWEVISMISTCSIVLIILIYVSIFRPFVG